jgi:hypothetical protein
MNKKRVFACGLVAILGLAATAAPVQAQEKLPCIPNALCVYDEPHYKGKMYYIEFLPGESGPGRCYGLRDGALRNDPRSVFNRTIYTMNFNNKSGICWSPWWPGVKPDHGIDNSGDQRINAVKILNK